MFPDINDLRIMRKRHGITQKQLSKLAGVSQSLIAKLEAGLIDASYRNVKKIMDVLEGLGDRNEAKAGDVISKGSISVNKSSLVSEGVGKMKRYSISQVLVKDQGHIVGLLAETDVIESIHQGKYVKKLTAGEIMQESPPSIPDKTPLKIVTELLRVSQIVIVTSRGNPIGVITKSDVLKKLT